MDVSVGSTFPESQSDTSALNLGQILRALRSHAILIGLFTVVAAALGLAYALSLPKTFTASGSIAVEGAGFAIPELQGALRNDNSPDPMPFVRTEVQALTSRELLEQVIGELHLDQDPEFNPALRPETLFEHIRNTITSLLPSTPGPSGDAGRIEGVYMSVAHALSLFQDNRSLVISMSFTSQDPQLSANFINTLVGDYVKARAARRAQADLGANKEIEGRIADVKANLDGIEKQMSEMRSRGDIVALRAGSVGQQQAEELATAAAQASVERTQLEANWNRATSLAKQGSSDGLAGVLNSPTVSRLRDQESLASSKLAELQSRYGANYPGVRSAAADLSSVRAQLSGEVSRIVASLGDQVKVAREKESNLKAQLAQARTAGVQAENATAQLNQLQQEATTRRALYQTLLEREQQTQAQPVNSTTPDIRVLSAAAVPGAPSGPRTKMIAGAGGLTGAILGCLIALLRLRTADGFDGPAEVTRQTGLPVIATLPRTMLRKGLSAQVLRTPNCVEAEALRSMRTRLRHAGRTSVPRCILLAAPARAGVSGELAAAFGRVAAAAGEHVLLIEGNLTAPTVARLMGVSSQGLTAVFESQADWRDSAIADPHGPLDLLVTDQKAASGAFLSSVQMQNLLVESQAHYDLVVIAGPVASTPEFQALALRADAAVLMLNAKGGNQDVNEAVAALRGRPGVTLTSALIS